MLNLLVIIIWLAAILTGGCAAPSQPAAGDSFAELCQALGKTDGKISKEELVAAARDKEQAGKIFDMCEKSPQGVLTVEEAARQNWAIRELIRLTPPPRLTPPRSGGK